MVHKSTMIQSGGGGSGTVTEIDTGTGLTGGPITSSGTVSIATNTANTLAGFNNSGTFSDVAIGTNLTLSGGTLNASGSGGANALPYSAITGTTTSAGTEQVIEATSGTFTLTLTNPTVASREAFPLWITNSGSGVVTISATYDGGTSFLLTAGSSVLYIFNGTSWLVF